MAKILKKVRTSLIQNHHKILVMNSKYNFQNLSFYIVALCYVLVFHPYSLNHPL